MVALDKVTGIKEEVISISMGSPKFLETKGVMISTFESFLSAIELRDVFDSSKDRTYFMFETNDESLFKLANEEWDDHLFSEARENNHKEPNKFQTLFGDMMFNPFMAKKAGVMNSDRMVEHLAGLIASDKDTLFKDVEYTEEKLLTYSKEQREVVMNELLSKGANLTEADKKILNFLVNNG